ncbi:MAG: hypothetical protein LBL55_06800 [Propionibacteriaceae bacterium]|jgi:hypothetical protein|nr:hypothetical protein [Propionibacteriaceae bacterium]
MFTADRAAQLAADLTTIIDLWQWSELAELVTSRTPGRPDGRRTVPGPRAPLRVEVLDLISPIAEWRPLEPGRVRLDDASPARLINAWVDWAVDRIPPVIIPPLLTEADDITLAQIGNAARILQANLDQILQIQDDDLERFARDIRRLADSLRRVQGETVPRAAPCPRCGSPLQAAGKTLHCANRGCSWSRTAPKLLTVPELHQILVDRFETQAPAQTTVQAWANQGGLTEVGRDDDGRPLFRADHAIRLWAQRLEERRAKRELARRRRAEARKRAQPKPAGSDHDREDRSADR